MTIFYAIKISEGNYLHSNYEEHDGITYTWKHTLEPMMMRHVLYSDRETPELILREINEPESMYWNDDLEFDIGEGFETMEIVGLEIKVKNN